MHSSKLNVQLLAQSLLYNGITHIVISPGSRNAPLVLEFSENPKFTCYSIVDERSAGFFALGLAQQLQHPVVVCSTSGSAVANYYPAVTESFYQSIPLLLITADRPENYTDIFDGQTIRQNHLFEKHSRANFQLKESEDTESISENFASLKKAIAICHQDLGPVHINMPFTEPLYQAVENSSIEVNQMVMSSKEYAPIDFSPLQSQWNNYSKKLILCGMLPSDVDFQKSIYRFAEDQNAVILSETTSNLSHPNIFSHIDVLLFHQNAEDFEKFAPELVLSIGQNVVSKKIKQLLRGTSLKAHWHLDEIWKADTFFQLSDYFQYPKTEFLQKLYVQESKSEYFLSWKQLAQERKEILEERLAHSPFSDLQVFHFLSQNIPSQTDIQFGNSSSIRYSQFFPFNTQHKVYCNRGTSGIEGSLATAIGACLASGNPTFFITGDIAFFYESNSLWNQYIPDHLKIILINNQGGEIFNFIVGPNNIPHKNTFLTTSHRRNAEKICQDFEVNYLHASNAKDLKTAFELLLQETSPSLLEINTSTAENSTILREYLS